ncbi:MAG TPA: phosphoribosylanthranilate isomerase [Methanobacteriaceae archaeon]|nr:phosphoribosylanthranilate isomerase [Methanobacteriaceae archaeon]
MKVKVCGIQRLLDVMMVDNVGADLVGFINIQRSKRYADLRLINLLLSRMEDFKKAVLVIEPDNIDEVIKKSKITGIKKIQLHSLNSDEIHILQKSHDLSITRVVGISETISPEKKKEIEAFSKVCDNLMFDYELNGQSGGTGRQIPLETAIKGAKIAKKTNSIDVFLAGGVNSGLMKRNRDKINQNFQGIDVNSGVEESPGIKDRTKLEEFMKILR